MKYNRWDIIETVRDISAGLDESGPIVCKSGELAYIISFSKREPDGIHAMLESGNEWWFKSNQVRLRPDICSLKIAGTLWQRPKSDNAIDSEEIEPTHPRS